MGRKQRRWPSDGAGHVLRGPRRPRAHRGGALGEGAVTRAHGTAAAALAAAILLVPTSSSAGVGDAGQSVAGFLAVPAGAAAPGMGGATLAFGGDLAAGFSNPAALGWVPGVAMALSHSQLPDGSRQEWASTGGNLGIA